LFSGLVLKETADIDIRMVENMSIVESCCGLDCSICEMKTKNGCVGCIGTDGTFLHGECKIAECVKKKGIGFCGDCGAFPCEMHDYCYNNSGYGADMKKDRIDRCTSWKNTLVKEAREGIDPVSYCGHHCDCCFLGQWCGGCRSGYNCCSFATLFKDKQCPNVTCAKEKGLDGCYQCGGLEGCEKGYYGNEGEYIAKATALFISKYGKDRYTATLKKAIKDGAGYPKDFDDSGSVGNALTLLERYM
jgi:hypothetical protein